MDHGQTGGAFGPIGVQALDELQRGASPAGVRDNIVFFFNFPPPKKKKPKMTINYIHHLKMYFLEMVIFQCHVSFQGCKCTHCVEVANDGTMFISTNDGKSSCFLRIMKHE